MRQNQGSFTSTRKRGDQPKSGPQTQRQFSAPLEVVNSIRQNARLGEQLMLQEKIASLLIFMASMIGAWPAQNAGIWDNTKKLIEMGQARHHRGMKKSDLRGRGGQGFKRS